MCVGKMKGIYKPRGKALEYGGLALDLYHGCFHGCEYCYVPKSYNKEKDAFHGSVKPREGILELLREEAPKYKGQEVFLCFACDPYSRDSGDDITRDVIRILHNEGVGVRILTKAGINSESDFDLLSKKPELSSYGATLTFVDHDLSKKWEPNASDPFSRMVSLIRAHDVGIPTWASLEPVIQPNESLKLISLLHNYVDEFKIGKWNHDPRADSINWKKFGHDAVELCEKLNVKYFIKHDLKKAM